MEGETTVVRVDVTTKIDTDTVGRQIDALRKNEELKTELVRLKAQRERLQRELAIKTRELATLRSKSELEAITLQRRGLIVQAIVSDLLGKATTALGDFRITRAQHLLEKRPAYDKSTVRLLTTARNYAEQAFELDHLTHRSAI